MADTIEMQSTPVKISTYVVEAEASDQIDTEFVAVSGDLEILGVFAQKPANGTLNCTHRTTEFHTNSQDPGSHVTTPLPNLSMLAAATTGRLTERWVLDHGGAIIVSTAGVTGVKRVVIQARGIHLKGR